MNSPPVSELDLVFGQESSGPTLKDRALSSKTLFVRSQDQFARVEPSDEPTGRLLTAWEALDAFGFAILLEAVRDGVAMLPPDPAEPAATLQNRREALGLTVKALSKATGLPVKALLEAEEPSRRSSIWTLQRIAETLALDDRQLGFVSGASADASLGARLKTIGASTPAVGERLVASLAEAAWIISTETRLRVWLPPSGDPMWRTFEHSDNYGDPTYPTWQHAYYLAERTRSILGLTPHEPVSSLRALATTTLGIPLVQMEMPRDIAGATVSNGAARGIVLNVNGYNSNVWIRRMTLAHELGHLLWDPVQELEALRVDHYDDLERSPFLAETIDRVERRANAFAVAFLAPIAAVGSTFRSGASREDGVRRVMETFGISFTAAKNHIANALDDDSLRVARLNVNSRPSPEWEAQESFTLDFFKPATTPSGRRGSFAHAVARAETARLISSSTAAAYLRSSVEEYNNSRLMILELFGGATSQPE